MCYNYGQISRAFSSLFLKSSGKSELQEYHEFMSTFVDEQNLNSNRQQGIIGEGESDSEVLHGEDTVQAGRTGGVEEESTEVNGGVVGEDGVVSAGAGEVDRQGNSINEQSDLVIEHI